MNAVPLVSNQNRFVSSLRVRRYALIALIALVGVAPWLLVNALFAQLPIFIAQTPESFNIASYIVLLTQVGNGVAALFVVFLTHRGAHWSLQQRANVCARAICVILVLETTASAAIAFLWTATLGGHSVAILLATVCGGIAGCMSVILVYPFTAPLQPVATVAMSTGMGLNGFVTAILALIQAPSQENRFDTTTFFLIITAVLVLSLCAFLFLWLTGAAHAALGATSSSSSSSSSCSDPHTKALIGGDADHEHEHEHEQHGDLPPSHDDVLLRDATLASALRAHWAVCAHQAVICFAQYVLLSLFSFATAPFANQGALLLYSNVCGNIFGPLARALSGVVALRTPRWLAAMTAVVAVLSVLLFAATFTPYMPGEALAFLSVAVAVVFGFEETTLFTKVAVEAPATSKAAASRAVGIANQIGACVGSLCGFGVAYSLG
jgi:hypothetical protein